MARKAKKRRQQMPPLSFSDKLIYYSIIAFLCGLYFALGFVPIALRERIAFLDEMVIASSEHMSSLWQLVPWMTFFLMTFILWLLPYQDRRPIFGLKNFKYGPPVYPKIYPLFMKNKPHVWVSQRAKQNRKQMALTLLVILLISFIPFPWSLYGRDALHADGSITQYSMFNNQVQEFSSGEIAAVEFDTYRYTTGKHLRTAHWGVQVTLTADTGKAYTFTLPEFRRDDEATPYWLSAMLRLKRRYDSQIITYDGIDDLSEVVSDKKLDETETELLYQLFGLR